jgi:phospholipase/carboxylesterase
VTRPDTVEVETRPEPDGSIIWLHGLGADGHDFEPIVPELRLPESAGLRFVFPHAPVRPVTLNGGMAMRAWYDIYSLDRSGPQDEAGIEQSARMLESLIERERDRGIRPERIVLAGFSQGGAIAMHTALRCRHRLAGLMGLSTWLPGIATADIGGTPGSEKRPKDLPVFLAHGLADPVLPIDFGRDARRRIEALGYSVEWHEYPMAHSVCGEEIADIRRWLLEVYAA